MSKNYNAGRFERKTYTPQEAYEITTAQMGESFWDDDRFDLPQPATQPENTSETEQKTETALPTPQKAENSEEKTDSKEVSISKKISKHSVKAEQPFLPGAEKWGLSDKQYE